MGSAMTSVDARRRREHMAALLALAVAQQLFINDVADFAASDGAGSASHEATEQCTGQATEGKTDWSSKCAHSRSGLGSAETARSTTGCASHATNGATRFATAAA